MLKRLSIVIMLCVAASGLYFKYQPELVYLSGRLAALADRVGNVAGSSVYRLPVALHRQERSLSCEIASLKMALSGVGIDVPESELVGALKFDPTPRANGTWGDPHEGFVGNIDGKMLGDGYGVYWKPVAQVALRYTNAVAIENGALGQLIYHLNQGRPVVVWGYFGNGNTVSWTTPAGRQVTGVNGEHARTLVGYTGSPTSPESLILMDPIYGELQWTVSEFLKNWSALDNGAVAVYGTPRWANVPGQDTVWVIDPDSMTRRALAMDWAGFLSHGGIPDGIRAVTQEWLAEYVEGPEIPPKTS